MSSRCARLQAVRERLRRFRREPVRDERGSAGVEFGIAAFIVIGIAAIAVDLYVLTKVDAAGGQMAVTMAEYVAHERTPDGDAMTELGRYLYDHALDAPAHLVFVVSVVQQPASGTLATLVWEDDSIRFGDSTATARLVGQCRQRGATGWRQTLFGQGGAAPAATLPDDSVAIIVEVCAELTRAGSLTGQFGTGHIYRLHAVPTRDKGQRPPAVPVYSFYSSPGRVLAAWSSPGDGSGAGPARTASGPESRAATAGVA